MMTTPLTADTEADTRQVQTVAWGRSGEESHPAWPARHQSLSSGVSSSPLPQQHLKDLQERSHNTPPPAQSLAGQAKGPRWPLRHIRESPAGSTHTHCYSAPRVTKPINTSHSLPVRLDQRVSSDRGGEKAKESTALPHQNPQARGRTGWGTGWLTSLGPDLSHVTRTSGKLPS